MILMVLGGNEDNKKINDLDLPQVSSEQERREIKKRIDELEKKMRIIEARIDNMIRNSK